MGLRPHRPGRANPHPESRVDNWPRSFSAIKPAIAFWCKLRTFFLNWGWSALLNPAHTHRGLFTWAVVQQGCRRSNMTFNITAKKVTSSLHFLQLPHNKSLVSWWVNLHIHTRSIKWCYRFMFLFGHSCQCFHTIPLICSLQCWAKKKR